MFIWLARFLVCPGIDLESCAGYSLSLSLNINTTSSQLFDSTYYKRAIKGKLLLFSTKPLYFQSLHCNVVFYFLNMFYFVYNIKPLQGGLVQNKTFSFKKSVVIFGET